MDLELSQEQLMIRDTVAGLVQKHCPLDTVRKLEDDAVGYSTELWSSLSEAGLAGILIPEQHGGAGMTMLDAAVAFVELGRGLAPTPLFGNLLAASLLQSAGSTEQQNEWLPRLASGDAIIATAWLEPDRGFGKNGVTLSATKNDGGYVLDGLKRHVNFASSATKLLVLAKDGDNVVLALVDPSASGVSQTQQFSVSSDNQFEVAFSGVQVAVGDVISADGWDSWEAAMRDGIILLAAQAVGGARYALDITVQYAKDRKQFDKQLGAFQALAHYMADSVTTVDGAETLMYEAAWSHSVGRETTRLAPMAKLFACQTYRDVTASAQQIFGGIGFTVEFDIQLYFRRAKQLQISWWDDRYLEELIAADVLDS